MSEEGQDDKQYEASQKKLDDARKKGEIPKSADLSTAAAYGGLLLALVVFGQAALANLGTLFQSLIEQSVSLSDVLFSGGPAPVLGGVFKNAAIHVSIFFGLPACFVLLSLIIQRGIVVAPSKIAMKLNRISPISGAKNKFGRQGIFEFAKSSTKLIIYCTVLGLVVSAQMDRIIGSLRASPGMVVSEMGRLLTLLLAIVVVVAVAIGLIDYLWQRAEHMRKHRMSRKEMTDEQKQSEGDPMLKQQRRQKGAELAMNKMLLDVPNADVILINPTHYAVALKWNRGTVGAPVLVAKGVDEIARKIREIGYDNSIPVHSDPPAARALHANVEIGDQIRPQDYAAVAAAIRFAETIRKKGGAR